MSEPTRGQFNILGESVFIFECLNRYIGYRKEIELRRCSTDMLDIMASAEMTTVLYSGSYAEGLRLHSSDIDVMVWCNDTRAVFDIKQINKQNNTNVLLMDTRHCRPGFSVLKVRSLTDDFLKQCVTYRYNNAYLNASQYKEYFLSQNVNSHAHGPCCSMTNVFFDFDKAHCIKCDYWPTEASKFITRCTRHQWPSVSVLDGIVKNGCHLVPVGAKYSENENLEWRISFSMAEKRLVSAFNRTQFLCYGLLKLVMSDVINKKANVSGLLCSYFLKTAVFWEVQENNPTLWQPKNILTCFWNCFDRLIKWVSVEHCPNFFIPENNMFCLRFTVKQQRSLLKRLQTLRNGGNGLFYKIPNLITDYISPERPMYIRNTEWFRLFSENHGFIQTFGSDRLQSLFIEFLSYKGQNPACTPAFVIANTLDNIAKTLVFRELNDFVNATELQNKDRYKIYRSRLYPYMRYLSSSSTYTRLYLAIALYTLGQYNTVIKILKDVETVSSVHSIEDIMEFSLNDSELQKHLFLPTILTQFSFLRELFQIIGMEDKGPFIIIPPLLVIKGMMFMCHHHMKNEDERKQALDDLRDLFDNRMKCYEDVNDLMYSIIDLDIGFYLDEQNVLRMRSQSF